jgi:hypothetical protein
MGRSKHTELDSTVKTKPGRESDEFGMLRERSNGGASFANDVRTGMGDQRSLDDEEAGRKGGIQVTTMYEVRRDDLN